MNKCINCKKETKGFGLRCYTCANKLKAQLSSSPKGEQSYVWKGGEKIRNRYCIDCNRKLNKNAYYLDTKRCKKCSRKLELNPNWQGGMLDSGYPLEFSNELKESIRKRDNYTCQNCNMLEEEHLIVIGHSLIIHHIDYNKENNNDDNLITVCTSCNIRANYNRDYWKELYINKIKEILQKEIK
jgi:hypothetical protein